MKYKIFYSFKGGSEDKRNKFKRLLAQSNKQRQNESDKKAENSKKNESTSSISTSSISTSSILSTLPDDLNEIDILIIGENHIRDNKKHAELKTKYINKNYYVFGEGFLKTDNTDNLDDYYNRFRTNILLASLYSKALNFSPSTSLEKDFLARQQDLLFYILQNPKDPPIEELKSTWEDIKDKKKEINSQLLQLVFPRINAITFDYNMIYQHYFQDDEINNPIYYNDMSILLDLSDEQGNILFNNENKSLYRDSFFRIIGEARETKMVERVLKYMEDLNRKEKIVIITGNKHVDNLYKGLSNNKNYTVKKYFL